MCAACGVLSWRMGSACGYELGRWITSFHRRVGRWLTDATPLLPLLYGTGDAQQATKCYFNMQEFHGKDSIVPSHHACARSLPLIHLRFFTRHRERSLLEQ